ncbi:MAG: ATP-binding protein, partial [Methylotenera sp.]|nr:ATP-binding protein [Oligoflexia bacterium]
DTPLRIIAWGELGLDGSIKDAGHRMRTLCSAMLEKVDCVVLPPHPKNEEALELLRKGEKGKEIRIQIVTALTLTEAWMKIQELQRGDPPSSLSLPALQSTAAPEVAATDTTLLGPKTSQLMPIRESLARALGVSAAGAHHLLLLGPKGTGKSHALEWLSAIQPPSSWSSQITQILLAELNTTEDCSYEKSVPIRRIGASARAAALLGSVSALSMRVGEYSLAHGGLLIADEFPEWPRDSRESLREPLERGKVTLSRTRGTIELPALFTLAANGNLCPCGGQLDNPTQEASRRCRCLPHKRSEYLNRLSGPVLDRIDLVIKLTSENTLVPAEARKAPVTPLELRTQVLKSHARALNAYGKPAGLLQGDELEELLIQRPDWLKYLNASGSSSLRSRHKILRIAISLGLWDNSELELAHFLEAASYRHERLFKT